MENLKILFDKANIKHIISVDDCYNSEKPIEKFNISQFFIENQMDAIDFCNKIGLADFEENIRLLDESVDDYIEAVVDNFTTDQIDLFRTKYQRSFFREKFALENFCENLITNGVIEGYKKIGSINEAKILYDKLEEQYDINSTNRILWMIDNDFQKANGTSDDGLKLISNFISNKKENNIFALTSAQAGDIDNETFRGMLNNDSTEKLLACVIHKHKIIDESYTELYEQMYFGFRENYSGSIIEHLNANLSHAASAAGESIKSIGEDAIHKVFLLGSKSEGVSPLETFHRLMMIILKTDVTSKLSANYDEISRLIYDYSKLCSWCSVKNEIEGDFKKIETIRRQECYDLLVNEMYTPVSSGDIFEIENVPYLLITQSCNVVIRKDGKRKALIATLLRIELSDKNDESHYLLDHYLHPKKISVSYNDVINIEYFVLDLCCLNSDGRLELSDDYDLNDFEHRYSEGVYIALREVVSKNKSILSDYKIIQEEITTIPVDELIEKVRTIYKANASELRVSFNEGVQYNGKRVCHLNQNILDDISKRYAEYHSRKGLDFDFTKKYKIIDIRLIYNFDFTHIGINPEIVSNILPESYKFFMTDTYDNETLRKDFSQYYRNNIFKTDKKINVGKININENTINIASKYIPIKVQDKIILEVIDFKENKISIKLPKEFFTDLTIGKLVNGTYGNDEQCVVRISNSDLTFTFGVGQAFICETLNLFVRKIEMKFDVDDSNKVISLKF